MKFASQHLGRIKMNKKYQIVYGDPPWKFEKGLWERQNSRASSHYPTMSLTEICNLGIPLRTYLEENCHLYLWIPSQQLGNGWGKIVYEAWGFTLKNIITWKKPQIGIGYYFRNTTEHLLFGVRGSLRTLDRKQSTDVTANRERHSQKPDIFRQLIVKCSGDLPRIELFARQKVEGWDCWGNEVESDIEL